MKLVLASGSPRRVELLDQMGLEFEAMTPDVDESRHPGEEPERYVERIARAKASMVEVGRALVVAADTCVVHDGQVMGKPAHPSEARSMLERLQGTTHEVLTGVAVSFSGETRSAVDMTQVTMLAMTGEEIADYVSTGEPMDKAGAYALQGRGGVFIASITGSPFTVIGMPIHLLRRLFTACGANIDLFKRPGPV